MQLMCLNKNPLTSGLFADLSFLALTHFVNDRFRLLLVLRFTLIQLDSNSFAATVVIFISNISFYRAMLCIRGTSHGPVSVCPCLCLSQVGVLSKRLNESSWFLACELPPPVLHCVKRKFGYLQKGHFPLELCPKLRT